jgi:hypothetical protein
MTVFVVTYWSLSGDEEKTEVMGVFDSKEKAGEYINRKRGYPANNDWFILEFEINKEN